VDMGRSSIGYVVSIVRNAWNVKRGGYR